MTSLLPPRASSLLMCLVPISVGCTAEPPEPESAEATEAPAVSTGREPAPERGAAEEDSESEDSALRVALPGLFSIMVGLQADMATVSRGLWLENFDTIAAGADAVADHPRVPQAEFQRISEILESDMSRFGGMDQEVHDLAVELSDAAGRGAMDEVLTLEADLRRGCVACHSEFRDRLRESPTTRSTPR